MQNNYKRGLSLSVKLRAKSKITTIEALLNFLMMSDHYNKLSLLLLSYHTREKNICK